MYHAFFLSPAPPLAFAYPVFYIPTHAFTVLLWPGVALGTLVFALFFWWVVHRRYTT